MDYLIGRMYYRTRDPEQVERMTYTKMKYWEKYNKLIDKAIEDATKTK